LRQFDVALDEKPRGGESLNPRRHAKLISRRPAVTDWIASLARTASPTNSLVLIEIGEALSASVRTLARVFSCASRIAGAITFVPFTCVGGSDRSERHS
jgi:hypothetical protein